MSARVFHVLIIVLLCSWGCKSKRAPVKPRTPAELRDGASQDADMLDGDELSRQLEATILENYLQLALGNMEAYADSVARDREIALVGIRPRDLIVGTNPQARLRTRKRLPFIDRPHCIIGRDDSPCLQLLPKTLDVHLYSDGLVGWIADEVSYRVPHQGREAAIPLRMTAIMMRDIDRWVLVMEHMSYGLPASDIVDMARSGALEAPTGFGDYQDDRNRSRIFRRTLHKFLNADDREKKRLMDIMERKPPVPGRAYLLLLPGPRQEYHGSDMFKAPSLAQAFGPGASVSIDSYRLSTAPNNRVAWMVTRLAVKRADPVSGRALTIHLRGTFLFVFSDLRWHLVQAHISVPMTEAAIERRLLGSEHADPTEIAREPAP